jgi:hypothetical protein
MESTSFGLAGALTSVGKTAPKNDGGRMIDEFISFNAPLYTLSSFDPVWLDTVKGAAPLNCIYYWVLF